MVPMGETTHPARIIYEHLPAAAVNLVRVVARLSGDALVTTGRSHFQCQCRRVVHIDVDDASIPVDTTPRNDMS